jgi:hypothetical protein
MGRAMSITYKDYSNIKFPRLHKVVYGKTVDGVQAQWQVSYKDYLVNEWLEENCKHGYYRSPGYFTEKFIEFQDDEEAFMFALKFGNGN